MRFSISPRAVDALVKPLAADPLGRQRGDDEARVDPLLQVLGLSHHTAGAGPAVQRTVGELLEDACSLARCLECRFGLLEQGANGGIFVGMSGQAVGEARCRIGHVVAPIADENLPRHEWPSPPLQ
jgi:hypothetical protein